MSGREVASGRDSKRGLGVAYVTDLLAGSRTWMASHVS